MRETIGLLRHERRARLFFVAMAQSALGTGAGYIALLLIAYDRLESPWAISLVLIADLIPTMLLGPVFGAAADRWSRKSCTVAADVIRVVAFAGIALADSYLATIAFAVLAGTGTGLFRPAALAALPSVVDDDRRAPAATALYGATADLGFTAGPALAAGVLVLAGPETLMLANAVTFGMSAVLLALLPFGAAPQRAIDTRPGSLLKEARDGLRATAGMRGVRILLIASAAALFGAGMFNVAELPFVTNQLGGTESVFALLAATFGVGFVAGSLVGSSGGAPARLRRRYMLGLLVFGAGFIATGFAPTVVVALVGFAIAGAGNGLVLVYERLLIQTTVPDSLVGRVFGVEDALTAWAFAGAFLAGGALVDGIGSRWTIAISGAIGIATCVAAALALRDEWPEEGGGGGDDGHHPGLALEELRPASADPALRDLPVERS